MPRKRTVISARRSRFHELDDLVLRLKGLVLARELRRSDCADGEELELYSAEIQRVRDRLLDVVKHEGAAVRPAA